MCIQYRVVDKDKSGGGLGGVSLTLMAQTKQGDPKETGCRLANSDVFGAMAQRKNYRGLGVASKQRMDGSSGSA